MSRNKHTPKERHIKDLPKFLLSILKTSPNAYRVEFDLTADGTIERFTMVITELSL